MGTSGSVAGDASNEHAVCGILEELAGVARERDRVRVGTLVEAFGHRGSGALLLVPALVEISPVGGIPGVPTVLAAIVLLFAVQIAMGRSHMWLPGIVERRSVDGEGLIAATRRMRPLADRLDRWFHGRLQRLVNRPFLQLAAVWCAVLACTVPPLELVPFASTLPMGAIAMFGLALLVRDGALMAAAAVVSVGALAGVAALVLG